MDNQMELMVRCRIEALVTEREGMIAANKQREFLKEPLAYDEAAFHGVTCQLHQIDDQLRSY